MRHLALLAILTSSVARAGDAPASPPLPGGPLSKDARDCSPARDHCIRKQSWFVTGFGSDYGNGMRPAYSVDGKWYLWDGRLIDGGVAYRTKVATAATLVRGKWAIVFAPPKDAAESKWPKNEQEALTSRRWIVVGVWEIDAGAGTVTTDFGTFPIDTARIPFDPQGL